MFIGTSVLSNCRHWLGAVTDYPQEDAVFAIIFQTGNIRVVCLTPVFSAAQTVHVKESLFSSGQCPLAVVHSCLIVMLLRE